VRLVDLGERRLITEVLRERYRDSVWRFGDDTSVMLDTREHRDSVVVATTDPAPIPVVWELGVVDRHFALGWLLAALNLSDLAAAGAAPVGLLTSLTLPNTMPLADFERLLDGVDACCDSVGTAVRGGNLKEGPDIHCEATAIGVVSGGDPLSRAGARPGDAICAIGPTGLFWAGMLAHSAELALSAAERGRLRAALTTPQPQVAMGECLRRGELVAACADNSDGLYGALWCIATGSGVGVRLDPAAVSMDPLAGSVARRCGVDPVRLALGFGDLQLVAAARPDRLAAIGSVCAEHGVGFTRLGEVVEQAGIFVTAEGHRRRLANFDNERFTPGSQFTGGLDAYRKRLFEQSLWADG
jgi:thiamine-monophosphate kinase